MNGILEVGRDIASLANRAAESSQSEPTGRSFGETLSDAVAQTDKLLVDADNAATGVATGETDTVEALIALSKAEVALRHVVSMTTRALEAYREVMRMQL